MSRDLNRRMRNMVGPVPLVDWRTAAVILLMTLGTPVLVWAVHAAYLHPLSGLLIGSYLMNLSFTAWHEPAHHLFSKKRWLNTVAGWIASFASAYPGYFARRREHLVHHKYEGIPGKDPVYPRIQVSFWKFPLMIVALFLSPPRLDVPDSFQPYTKAQRLSDNISNLLVVVIVVVSILYGFWWALLWGWILPRGVVFGVHALYICYFPHAIDGGGYQVLRIRRDTWLLRLLMINQHLHGLHHGWPWIPWYRYQAVLRAFAKELRAAGLEGPWRGDS
jgi:beta-carotene hydroxylase